MFTSRQQPSPIGPERSRAAANDCAPIQFTLKDAQVLWKRRFKAKVPASREKIQAYIEAKKLGWKNMQEALNREEAPKKVEDIGSPVKPASKPEPGKGLWIDDLDEEMVSEIQKKQSTPVSESAAKHETDLRKYSSSQHMAKTGEESGKALNLFYVKNSPIGYNRSVETEEEGIYDYQFEPAFDRDFTFRPKSELDTERRVKTDYFRATASHKHVRREEMDKQVSRVIRSKEPGKAKEIGTRQVYMSFYVEKTSEKTAKLKITSPEGAYKDVKMLGALHDKPISITKVMIGGHPLTLWINEKTAGHQSKYNASAIVPNQVQYQEILETLQGKDEVEIDPADLSPEREFEPATIEWALGTKRDTPIPNYKGSMMEDRKDLISVVSTKINESVKNGQIKAITADEGFFQYPCLVLQPMEAYAEKHPDAKGKSVDHLKENIVLTLHEEFQFSFANRQSFGFANPTVGDVGTSVRIWPGLLNQSLFQQIMFKTLSEAGLLKTQPKVEVKSKFATNSPLVEALKLAIIRAKTRHREYTRLKEQPSFGAQKESYSWVLNRITSNVIKAEELIKLLIKSPNDLDVNHRATRTLENLNEYDLIQAGLEEDVQAPAQGPGHDDAVADRQKSLLTAIRKPVLSKEIAGWIPVAVRIRSSGMDAYRAALEIVGDSKSDSSRLYFETAKVNQEIAKLPEGMTKAGSVTKMMDPSYNFVSRTDVDAHKSYTWENKSGLPDVHIYDITNTTLDDTFRKIGEPKPQFVICFESLSKHFQFGMDKTTLGRLMVYRDKKAPENAAMQQLQQRAEKTDDTPLPAYTLNYMALQSTLFGV